MQHLNRNIFVLLLFLSCHGLLLNCHDYLQHFHTFVSIHLSVCLPTCPSICLSCCLFCLSSVFLSVFPSAGWHTFLDALVWNGLNIASNPGFPTASDGCMWGGGDVWKTGVCWVPNQRSNCSLCNSQEKSVSYGWTMDWYWSEHSRTNGYEV